MGFIIVQIIEITEQNRAYRKKQGGKPTNQN